MKTGGAFGNLKGADVIRVCSLGWDLERERFYQLRFYYSSHSPG